MALQGRYERFRTCNDPVLASHGRVGPENGTRWNILTHALIALGIAKVFVSLLVVLFFFLLWYWSYLCESTAVNLKQSITDGNWAVQSMPGY